MAIAQVEERHLLKTLRWYDGFVICLANPGFMLGSLGWTVLDMGGWGAALIWGLTALIIIPVIVLYSELAAMFPNRIKKLDATQPAAELARIVRDELRELS